MKKKTNEEEHTLAWYLNGGLDESSSTPAIQEENSQKEIAAPVKDPIEGARQQKDQVVKNKSDTSTEQSEKSEIVRHIEQSQNTERGQHAENTPVQRRISARMRKETLEAYKQAFLLPTKLSSRKAVYLSGETQERADFIVRRLGDRGSNLSSFVENLVRSHLEEYHEDIEKWRKL